jgi:thiol-disulfide isomerase/thioredoxin
MTSAEAARPFVEKCAAMTITRGCFLSSSTALVAARMLPVPADARPADLKPHKHGINGSRLNLHTHYNLKLRILDGPDWSLESARGSVVFLNFFATWCPPCRDETPELIAFGNAHPEVTVVPVDVGEPDDTVRAYRKKYGVPFPIGIDRNSNFYEALGCGGYPTTFIFRPDGRLSCALLGGADRALFEEELRYALDPSRDPSPSPEPSSEPA